jgi:hypothetical protein
MTRDELLEQLRELRHETDVEHAHLEADLALLRFIADPEVTEAFEEIRKWYS